MPVLTDKISKDQDHSVPGATAAHGLVDTTGVASFADHRPVAGVQQRMQEAIDHSPRMVQLREMYTAPLQPKKNQTGLPDQLKTGVEHLSGFSLDDVQVHYNSDQPAQFQAHAFAQGSQIHLGPGQEKHLPHEAWHVVQQKQGRVRPTAQLRAKVPVNDDVALEREADVMGARALGPTSANSDMLQQVSVKPKVLQGAFLDIQSSDFKGYIAEQEKKQRNVGDIDGPFTTVGFEHEFTQTVDENTLAGISHLEFAKSRPLPFTGLPFILETDAANALELVSPPFLIKTLKSRMIPDPADVEAVDNMIRKELTSLAERDTIGNMVDGFKALDIDFTAVKDLTIERKNLSHKSKVQDYSKPDTNKLDFEKLKDIKIKPSEKGGGITSQVNFATDARTFDDLQKINQEQELDPAKFNPGFNPKAILATLEGQLKHRIDATGIRPGPNLTIFLNHLVRILSGQFALPAIKAVKMGQEEVYQGKNLQADEETYARFRFSAYLSSAVKDVHGVWMKDSLMNVGLGLLDKSDWGSVKKLITNDKFRASIAGLSLPEFSNINGFEKDLPAGNKLIADTLETAKKEIISALDMISWQIERVESDGRSPGDLAIVPIEEVDFMGHNEEIIGPRQDTYVDPRNVQLPGAGQRLHVVESRRDVMESLYRLGWESGDMSKAGLIRLAQMKENKRRSVEAELEKLEKDLKRINAEEQSLTAEGEDIPGKLSGYSVQEYQKKLAAFKQQYREQNKGAEAGKNPLGRFDKQFQAEKAKLEKRPEAIDNKLREIAVQRKNILLTRQKKMLEMDAYIAELKAIQVQLQK